MNAITIKYDAQSKTYTSSCSSEENNIFRIASIVVEDNFYKVKNLGSGRLMFCNSCTTQTNNSMEETGRPAHLNMGFANQERRWAGHVLKHAFAR